MRAPITQRYYVDFGKDLSGPTVIIILAPQPKVRDCGSIIISLLRRREPHSPRDIPAVLCRIIAPEGKLGESVASKRLPTALTGLSRA